LAQTTDLLLDKLKISRYSLCLREYGALVGFRIAVAHPERVQALIIQNGNAYKEGRLKWAKIAKYWADPVAMRASQPTIDVSPLSECLAQQFARSAISFDFAGLLVRFFRASASITDKLS